MNSEIQQRIQQIQSGKVPEGYQMTKIGIIPKDWKVERVNDNYSKSYCEVNL